MRMKHYTLQRDWLFAFPFLFALFFAVLGTQSAMAFNNRAFVVKLVPHSDTVIVPISGTAKVICYKEGDAIPDFPDAKTYSYKTKAGRNCLTKTTSGAAIKAGQTYFVEVLASGADLSVMMSGDIWNNKAVDDLVEILHWGDARFRNMSQAFYLCRNLTLVSATDRPTFTYSEYGFSLLDMFRDCKRLTKINNLAAWQDYIADATSLQGMFWGCLVFKGEGIEAWKPKRATTLRCMFRECIALDVDFSGWADAVAVCRDFGGMFVECSSFRGRGLDNWKVVQGRKFNYMFLSCKNLQFKPDNWKLENVESIEEMFQGCTNLDNSIRVNFKNWARYVRRVESLRSLFNGCSSLRGAGLEDWFTTENKVKNLSYMFMGCKEFNRDLGKWNVSQVTSMRCMFRNCSSFDGNGLDKWTVDNVEDMSEMFFAAESMKKDLGEWNISNVKNINSMFACACPRTNFAKWNPVNCTNFTSMFYYIKDKEFMAGSPSNWDVSNGILFTSMFEGSKFKGDLKNWKLRNATNTARMFASCSEFNSDLSRWYVENIEDASAMFLGCKSFNADLSQWQFGNLMYMRQMFEDAVVFNSDLSKWNVSKVKDMSYAFRNRTIRTSQPIASQFNGDVSEWDVSACENFEGMFYGCNKFQGDLSKWNMGKAQSLSAMFYKTPEFDADLSAWNVENVTNMDSLFYGAAKFNANIANWNTSSLRSLFNTFTDAQSFNYSLGRWNISKLEGEISLANCGMGVANYDRTIEGWRNNPLNSSLSNIKVTANKLLYRNAKTKRQELIDLRTWKFEEDREADKALVIVEPLSVKVKRGGDKNLSYSVINAPNTPNIVHLPPDIVTATATGGVLKVHGEKDGKTHLRLQVGALADRAYDDCDVRCYVAISDLSFAKSEYEVAIGDKLNLKRLLTVKPNDVSDKDAVRFRVIEGDQIAVDEKTGIVTGLSEGTAKVEVVAIDDDETDHPVNVTMSIKVKRVDIAEIKLLPTEGAFIGVGMSLDMRVEFIPANTTDKTYDYRLSDDSVLAIAGDKVTGKKEGICTVTVTSRKGGKTATTTIRVVANYIPVANLMLENRSTKIAVRATKRIGYYFTPHNATNRSVYWESSDSEIVSVESDGLIRGLKVGKARVTVRSAEDPNAADICEVEVYNVPVSAIVLLNKEKPVVVAKGRTREALPYRIEPEDASNLDVEWLSSDDSKVKVDKTTGELEGLQEGTVEITVRAVDGNGNISDTHKNVKCVELVETKQLQLSLANVSMIVGEEVSDFTVKYLPANATDRAVTWTMEDESIAQYDPETQTIKALGVGETTLTVALNSNREIKATAHINVRANVFATDILLTPAVAQIAVDQQIKLTLIYIPYYATKANVDWTVEDADDVIAFDEKNLLVTGRKEGTAIVRATLKGDSSKSVECKITVAPTTATQSFDFDVNPAVYEIAFGDEGALDLNTKIRYTPPSTTDRWLDWSSASPDIVWVMGGVVRGLKESAEGVQITAKLHSNPAISKTCIVKVKAPAYPLSFRLDAQYIKLKVGDVIDLEARDFVPASANDMELVWSSTARNCVEVAPNGVRKGKVTALSSGFATILVKLKDKPEIQTTCFVEVLEADSKALVANVAIQNVKVEVGRTVDLQLEFDNPDAAEKGLIFEGVDNEKFSIIDNKVRGISVCENVKVTARLRTNPAVRTVFYVTVEPQKITEKFELNQQSLRIYVNTEVVIRVKVEPANVDLSAVVWTSDDETICTVHDGIVKGIKEGKTTVRATLGSRSASCEITVRKGVDQPEAVTELEELNTVSVAPNPFNDRLRITHCELRGTYALLNAQGVVVRSGKLDGCEVMLETSELTSGLYLLRITTEHGATKTIKVVKN